MKNLYFPSLLIASLLSFTTTFAQFKPTEAARGFSIFVKENLTFRNGNSYGPVAIGGNAILEGQVDVASQSSGSFPYGAGSSNNYGLVVGGKLILTNNALYLRNGKIRIADATGITPVAYDCWNTNQLVNLRIIKSAAITDPNVCNSLINQLPRVELLTTQAEAVTTPSLVHIESSFTLLNAVSAKMAKYVAGAAGTENINFVTFYYASQWDEDRKLNPRAKLVTGKVNVLNIKAADFNKLTYLLFETQPDANTPLVINVDYSTGAADFNWVPGNFDRLQASHAPFIIYNFYNTLANINITGNHAIHGSILASTSTIRDTHSNGISGQVIAKNYIQENWSFVNGQPFTATLPEMGVTPATPLATNATNISYNSFTSVWNAATNATSYKIDVSTSVNFGSVNMVASFTNLTVNGLSQTITGLNENTEYFFRIRALNGSVVSANSNVVSVITHFNPTTTIFKTKNSGNFSDANTWQYNLVKNTFRDTTGFPCITNKTEVSANTSLTLDINYTVGATGSFSMANSSKLVINASRELNIAGTVNFNGQDVTLKSTINGTARLGEITGTLNGATNVSVERYINAGRKWRLLTAPINGTTIHDAWQEGKSWDGVTANNATFTGTLITGQQQKTAAKANANGFDFWSAISNSSSSVKKFTRETGKAQWDVMPNTLGTFDGVTAYIVFIRGDRSFSTGSSKDYTVLKAKGTLKDAQKNVSSVILPGEINLVGNPFASPIDFEKFYAANSGAIQKKFWLWDATLNTYGGFRLVSATPQGYETIPFNMAEKTTDYQFIESGQGFFVFPSKTTAQQITFAQNQKTNRKPATPVFRMGNGTDEQLYINLNAVSATEQLLVDGAKITYGANYSEAIDENDIIKNTNINENLSIYRSKTNLTVEARPLFDNADTIVLNLTATTVRNYQFQFKGSNFASAGVIAFLQDDFLKTTTPIDLTGEITTIDFAVTSNAASTGANRFKIILTAPKTLPVTISSVKAYSQQTQVVVEWNAQTESNMKGYEVERSTDGRSFTKQGESAAKNTGIATTYKWMDATPSNGTNYYRIKIISNTGEIKYTEVVAVKMNSSNKAEIAVYPNPVTNNVISLQMNGLQKDKYALQLFNAGGQKVLSQFVDHQGGSATQTISFSTVVAPGIYKLTLTSNGTTYNQTILVK